MKVDQNNSAKQTYYTTTQRNSSFIITSDHTDALQMLTSYPTNSHCKPVVVYERTACNHGNTISSNEQSSVELKHAPTAPILNSANVAKVSLRFTLDDLPDLTYFDSDDDEYIGS